METTTLSESALALLRRMGGERVPVTDDTRPAYRGRDDDPAPYVLRGQRIGLPSDGCRMRLEGC
jgi:hypothetical protein